MLNSCYKLGINIKNLSFANGELCLLNRDFESIVLPILYKVKEDLKIDLLYYFYIFPKIIYR